MTKWWLKIQSEDAKQESKSVHEMLILSKREFTVTMVNMLKTNGRKYAAYKDR